MENFKERFEIQKMDNMKEKKKNVKVKGIIKELY